MREYSIQYLATGSMIECVTSVLPMIGPIGFDTSFGGVSIPSTLIVGGLVGVFMSSRFYMSFDSATSIVS